jgi:hypothetical protein
MENTKIARKEKKTFKKTKMCVAVVAKAPVGWSD